ncbi:MAG TPA: response regulator [Chloroflexota bacterium]|jgi:CheY-like chemotaxis protein|nr:response regulator [Chloroflexota bacterium]
MQPIEPGETEPLVLVIEDGPYIGEMVRTALEDEGYRVRLEATGRGGLAAARRECPRAIVLDLMLPDLDGREVLRVLKADAATRPIPVVVMSAVAAALKPDERRHVAAVVRKPFELEDLFSALARAVEG